MNNCDKYILRCIQENKISVDTKNGEVYSHYKKSNYKIMTNYAGYEYLDFQFFDRRWSVLVHRVIYLAEYKNIPDNFHIHHIDKNPKNNNIKNLIALSPEDHRIIEKS